MGGDNWNVDSIEVFPLVDGARGTRYLAKTGSPVKRFTAEQKSLVLSW